MDEAKLSSIIEHFMLLNGTRLQHVYQALNQKQADFLRQLPGLFEHNSANLPGYINDETPCGVCLFRDDEANGLHQNSPDEVDDNKPIKAIYLIGSTGTAAYSKDSDIDIWLCYQKGLTKEQMDLLQQKTNKIEDAADQIGLELHFFLMNDNEFRIGRTVDLSHESSGSAQHDILLDEFYRTSILLAGCFPAWWVVPPELEDNYDLCIEQYHNNQYAFSKKMINFGGLQSIALEEYFGGSVWQLSKAIDAPYKSFMKLLLIEAYVHEHPETLLLSQQYKQAVYQGEIDRYKLDPYIMLLEKISKYLESISDYLRKDILYRSFYFKVGLRLTNGKTNPNLYQHDMLLRLVNNWGWSLNVLSYLDTRKQWNILDVLEERQVLYEALAKSYRKLTTFSRKVSGNKRISKDDITIIGRKLFAVYERKAGKVDIIAQGLHGYLKETEITLYKTTNKGKQSVWNLYAGTYKKEIIKNIAPLKQALHITDLIVWGYFNKIIDIDTTIKIFGDKKIIQQKKIERILNQIKRVFQEPFKILPGLASYSQPSTINSALFFVDLELNNGDLIDTRKWTTCSSQLHIEQIILTNWHEVYVNHFTEADGLIEMIRQYLAWYVYRDVCKAEPPAFIQSDPDCKLCTTITQNLTQLFESVVDFFVTTKQKYHSQYILQVDDSYYMIAYAGLSFRRKKFADIISIYEHLSHTRREFIKTEIDPHTEIASGLREVYKHNKKNVIQFYYQIDGDKVKIAIADERGSLFRHKSTFFDEKVLINQYAKFIDSIISRINILVEKNINPEMIDGFEFIKLISAADGRCYTELQEVDLVENSSQAINIQVIADSDDLDSLFFTIYLDGVEYSSLTYGNALYKKVAEEVVNLRPSRGTYPVFITDISIASQLLGEGGLERIQSSHFYKYKIRVEERINMAIAQL